MNSAILCSLAGRYDNPIPPPFLAPIDFLKIPAQEDFLKIPAQEIYSLGIENKQSLMPKTENP
jgi:hypothetical protein